MTENETDYKTEYGRTDRPAVSRQNPAAPAAATAAASVPAAAVTTPVSGDAAVPASSDPETPAEKNVPMIVPIYAVLEKKNQISISGMARALKEYGADEHRLVVTGYLRALRDLNCLTEIDILPSKIYMIKKGSADVMPMVSADSAAAFSGASSGLSAGASFISGASSSSDATSPFPQNDAGSPEIRSENRSGSEIRSGSENRSGSEIYMRLKHRISVITDRNLRFEAAVYILCSLFDRPCFESEVIRAGCDGSDSSQYFAQPDPSVRKVKIERPDLLKLMGDLNIPAKNAGYRIASTVSADTVRLANEILFSLLKEEIDLTGLAAKQAKNLFDF